MYPLGSVNHPAEHSGLLRASGSRCVFWVPQNFEGEGEPFCARPLCTVFGSTLWSFMNRHTFLWSSLLMFAPACESGVIVTSTTREPSKHAFGEDVEISAGELALGFSGGILRDKAKLSEFSISKHPVSVGQYRECMSAGACEVPDEVCSNVEGHKEDAMLCAGENNAASFCSWLGGRLPALDQWFYAARGSSISRYPWGKDEPTCAQHPLASVAESQDYDRPPNVTRCNEPRSEVYRTKVHKSGASQLGVEDILLAPAELLRGSPGQMFSTCGTEGRGCLVYGISPGSIDSVGSVESVTEAALERGDAAQRSQQAYGFRCVWQEARQ